MCRDDQFQERQPPVPETGSHPPQVTAWWRGEGLAVLDYRCGAARGEDGPEEATAGNEVVLPRRGHFVWRRGRREWPATSQTALLARAGDGYRVRHPACGGDRCTVLCLADHLFDEFHGGAEMTARAVAPAVHRRHYALLRGLRRGHEPLAIAERAHALLRALRGEEPGAAAAPTAGQRALANAALELVSAGYRAPLRLAELARALRCSPFHLTRVFARVHGASLHRFQVQLRLHEAMERLLDGESDLTALALQLGFADHPHFTRAFRRAYGRPPSACREELRAAGERARTFKR